MEGITVEHRMVVILSIEWMGVKNNNSRHCTVGRRDQYSGQGSGSDECTVGWALTNQ